MEFGQNHIDDIFRQRLHSAEAPPPPFVWANVERELQKRKRRRLFFWLFAFGVAGTGAWAMLTRHEANTPLAVTEQVFSKTHSADRQPTQGSATQQEQNLSPETRKTDQQLAPGIQGPWAKGVASTNIQPAPLLKNSDKGEVNSLIFREKASALEPGQTIQSQTSLSALSPLNTIPPEPLIFSRTAVFPQVKAKTFVRKKRDPKYCYDFAQNPNVWMLDVYAGPSFSRQALVAASPAFEPYKQTRLATEKQDWAFNAGLRGSLLLGRHFLVRTGLHYEQATDVFEYIDPNYVKYIVEIITQPGEPTIIDTVDVQYGENYVKTYNRYGLLDIPLEVGGEIRSGRFGLSLNAGVSFNVLFWKRGTILSPGGQPLPFTPGKQGATEVFRPRSGWSAGASGQVFFHLQPRLRVFAEPYFRQILKPITLGNQPVDQRYRNWGIKIGATKILD